MSEHYYRLGGLLVASERELAHAQLIEDQEQAPDVCISFVNQPLPRDEYAPLIYDAVRGDRNQVLLEIPELGQFVVENGRAILVYLFPDVLPGVVELYLLGTVMGLLYHQRGIHPLHAACVARQNAAIALAGDSGEGKTTLAYALSQRGYELLTDDVAPLTRAGNDFLVHREKSVFKIWQETARHFSVPTQGLAAINNRDQKYYLPAAASQMDACSLKSLVILHSDDRYTKPTLEPVPRLQALAGIRQHTYRNFLIPTFWGEASFLERSLQLANSIKVWRLVRPRSLQHLQATADVIASL